MVVKLLCLAATILLALDAPLQCNALPANIEIVENQNDEPIIIPKKECSCGKANRASRIVGGSSTEPREFPWQIGLIIKYADGGMTYPVCGGTIVSPNYVITAAHCTHGRNSSMTFAIHYGTDRRMPSMYRMIDVVEITDHEYYNHARTNNDISILKLAKPLEFTDTVGPACLPDPGEDFTGKDAIVSGWGNLYWQGKSPSSMRKVTLPVMSDKACRAKWGWSFKASTMLCAEPVPGKDSCQGDSGGPFVTEVDGHFKLAGVVSFGNGCAKPGWPGIYTRVSSYIKWINAIVYAEDSELVCSA